MLRLMSTPEDVSGAGKPEKPEEYTMEQLAELVIKITGSQSPIVTMPLPQDDPNQRCPNIEMARRVLGWRPKIAVADRDVLASDIKGLNSDAFTG
jgi:UDP-glucuronate decarboxylase